MKQNFAKVIDSRTLEYAPNPAIIVTTDSVDVYDDNGNVIMTEEVENRRRVYNPTAEQYLLAVGGPFFPVDPDGRSSPEVKPGMMPSGFHYEEADGKIVTVWEYAPVVLTQDDYDEAMERHMKEARCGRGYTTREPSAYAASSNPRFAQDARDWQRFVDEVMGYALVIMNRFADSGEAPTLPEFIAGMPKVRWTYEETVDAVTDSENGGAVSTGQEQEDEYDPDAVEPDFGPSKVDGEEG